MGVLAAASAALTLSALLAVPSGSGALAQSRPNILVLMTDDQTVESLFESPTYSAIRTPGHVFVQHSTGEQELYDLATDPHQLTSLHADVRLAALKTDLGARLARVRVCAGDACRRGPDVRLGVRYRRGRGGCARSRVALRVGGSAASRIASVAFYRGPARSSATRGPRIRRA